MKRNLASTLPGTARASPCRTGRRSRVCVDRPDGRGPRRRTGRGNDFPGRSAHPGLRRCTGHDHRVHGPAVPVLRAVRPRHLAAAAGTLRGHRQGPVRNARPAPAVPRVRPARRRGCTLRRTAGQVLGVPRGTVPRPVTPGPGTLCGAGRYVRTGYPRVSKPAVPTRRAGRPCVPMRHWLRRAASRRRRRS